MRIFSKSDSEIFQKIKANSIDDLNIWKLSNLAFPLFTVLMSILIFLFSDNLKDANSFFNFFLNGSLPLIGINLIVAASFFLIKFNKEKETKLGLSTSNLRQRLIIYSLAFYLFSSSIFVIQTLYSPFNTAISIAAQLGLSFLSIYTGLLVSARLFLLQEDLIDRSYDQRISESVNKLKDAIPG